MVLGCADAVCCGYAVCHRLCASIICLRVACITIPLVSFCCCCLLYVLGCVLYVLLCAVIVVRYSCCILHDVYRCCMLLDVDVRCGLLLYKVGEFMRCSHCMCYCLGCCILMHFHAAATAAFEYCYYLCLLLPLHVLLPLRALLPFA